MTPEAVKHLLIQHGISIREWARSRGFSESLVYSVLAGKCKGLRGESYWIAVELGLKKLPKKTPQGIRLINSVGPRHPAKTRQEKSMS